MENKENFIDKKYNLESNWTFWAHLPHDTDWSPSSYKEMINISSFDELINLYENLPDIIIKNCMIFLMREGIKPTWEDESNKNGGCFSYKIINKSVVNTWKNLSYLLIGESLLSKEKVKIINGITISPKKSFCIIKIWLSDCSCQDPKEIEDVDGLCKDTCIFKKHL